MTVQHDRPHPTCKVGPGVQWSKIGVGDVVFTKKYGIRMDHMKRRAGTASSRLGRHFRIRDVNGWLQITCFKNPPRQHVQINEDGTLGRGRHDPAPASARAIHKRIGNEEGDIVRYTVQWGLIDGYRPVKFSDRTTERALRSARASCCQAGRRLGRKFRAQMHEDGVYIYRLDGNYTPTGDARRLRKEMPVGAQVVVSESTDDMTVRQARQHARKCRQKWRHRYAVRVEDRGTVIERVA